MISTTNDVNHCTKLTLCEPPERGPESGQRHSSDCNSNRERNTGWTAHQPVEGAEAKHFFCHKQPATVCWGAYLKI